MRRDEIEHHYFLNFGPGFHWLWTQNPLATLNLTTWRSDGLAFLLWGDLARRPPGHVDLGGQSWVRGQSLIALDGI